MLWFGEEEEKQDRDLLRFTIDLIHLRQGEHQKNPFRGLFELET